MSQMPMSSPATLNFLFRLIGIILLVLVLFDIIAALVPPHFTDPVWEFQFLGYLVERAPLPFIALLFLYWSEASNPKSMLTKFLSWGSLVIGVLFLLTIPLSLRNSARITELNNQQVATRMNQQMAPIQQRKQVLQKSSDQDIAKVFTLLERQNQLQGIKNPTELKKRLFEEIGQAESNVSNQLETARETARINVIKNSTKWNAGALVVGVAFILIWWVTPRKPRLA
ncbi:HpsJ-like protein, cyanoexosortase A-associated [Anthocerotibacter panamensis]|uniref:HpsJ-like protein, cyanoexosortase A-associated n=1 Tax=Anthocerotibacter panamensis TaxID=2857077 RepID=UPI001C4062A7|nr:HpsJ family protein [Anthocerotibacter panamensis]